MPRIKINLKKYSFSPILRRWYRLLTILLTLAVWSGLALALMPIKDTKGNYSSYPFGLLTGVHNTYAVDNLFQLRDVLHPQIRERGLKEPITIIEVDEASIRESNVRLQKWPRTYYAQLIKRASDGGASMIGLDLYLSEEGGISAEDKAADQQIAQVIADAGNVVIAQKLEAGGSPAIKPLPMFAEAAYAVGFVDLPHDSDRFVRSAQLLQQRAGEDVQFSFAACLAQGYKELALEPTDDLYKLKLGDRILPLRPDLNLQIDFRKRTPGFQRVSAKDILKEMWRGEPSTVSDDLFRDRIVLIGATNNDAPDLFSTPFYQYNSLAHTFDRSVPRGPALMPGIEVHANALTTILFGKDVVRPSYMGQIFSLLPPLVLVALAIFFLRPVWGFLAVVLVAVGIVMMASWIFNTYAMILPMATAVLGVVGVLAPAGFLLRYAHEQAVREEKEAERAAIMDIFSRCVSPEVAETLWQQRGALSLGGERRTVTVIFTDIRGFTTLSESVTSEQVVEWLNDYFSRMHKVVSSYGGHINKFIGDGLMIVFGAPIARGDKLEARAAVACGLEMLEEVERLNEEWKGTGRPHIAIGVGIHTGEATCGVVGAEGRLEYTLIGDTVNLTARLESTTKDKGVPILVSDATAKLLGVDYETQPMGEVKVKGKTQSTTVHTVKKADRAAAPVEVAQIA